MLTKRQILNRLHYIKQQGYEYSAAIKAVTTPQEIESGERVSTELRIVPVIIDTEEQFDYTLRYVRVMVSKDNREVVFGTNERLEYIYISGAHSEQESNRQLQEAIRHYCEENGFNNLKSEDEMVELATECLAEYSEVSEDNNVGEA